MAQPVYGPQMLRKDLRGEFIEALMEPIGPTLVDQVATIFDTTSDKENFAWLSNPYEMEEITDQMPIHPLTDTGLTAETGADDTGYEVKVKTYGGALLFKRDDLADEKVGGFKIRIQDAAGQARFRPDGLLVDKLVAGTSDTCYLRVGATAEAMFSATHAARGKQTATWSNYLTGTGTSVAQVGTDLGSAIAALYNMTNEAAVPMNSTFRRMFIMYPPALEASIRTAVLGQLVSSTSNVGFAPEFDLIREPRLTATSTVDYYVGISDAKLRGLGWLRREDVRLEEIGVGSELWTNLRQVEYATTIRGRACFVYPQRLVMINNT